jgi:DNA invertase Pin-like site-specific DNA recombinase
MRVAIYARYSSDLQSASSIEDQIRLCRTHAARAGWDVTRVFEDRAMSGGSVLRPGYQRLLDAVLGGEIDVVLAEALDRLSRDQEDIAALFKRLRFLGVTLVTVSEGEVGDLHIGLKGAMNALYLKDLADKTRRGLEGRVRAGRSGGGLCYGYEVVTGEERGGRVINPDEARVVRRIFEAFAAGQSPKAIARQLNAERIPGPRGLLWRDTAIRGHRTRGTGVLNNELYLGRLVWNRQRFVKDPRTGRRVARPNSPAAWVVEEVPHLRIIDDALWERAKARQGEIDASPKVRALKQNRFWEHRRPVHLLTGLVQCARCGGTFISAGSDYLACGNARKLDQCSQRKAVRRSVLEDLVLDLVRQGMMQPEMVKVFVSAYTQEINAGRADAEAERSRHLRDLASLTAKIEGLYDAIAEGFRSPGLLAKLEGLEAQKLTLEQALAAPPPPPVRLHPNLAELYGAKVAQLRESLADPSIRDEALGLLRGLITRVVVDKDQSGWNIDIQGQTAALVALGSRTHNAPGEPRLDSGALSSAKVVAGAGFGHWLRLSKARLVPH